MVQPRAGQGAVQIALRLPVDMRDKVKSAAEENGRSINSEIVARLEATLQGNLPDLSAVGFGALVKRLEASVDASTDLLFSIRDDLPGIEKLMAEKNMTRQEAARHIISDWLAAHGYK